MSRRRYYNQGGSGREFSKIEFTAFPRGIREKEVAEKEVAQLFMYGGTNIVLNAEQAKDLGLRLLDSARSGGADILPSMEDVL